MPVDAPTGTARLLIRVRELGPKAVVGNITVEKLEKNTDEAFQAYLGIRPGMPIDAQQCDAIRDKLWESGRFVSSRLEAVPSPTTPGTLDLRFEVKEYEKTPPLSEPPSRVDETLLKFRRWLVNPSVWQDDLVLRSATKSLPPMELIVSPRRGTLVRLGKHAAGINAARWESPPQRR